MFIVCCANDKDFPWRLCTHFEIHPLFKLIPFKLEKILYQRRTPTIAYTHFNEICLMINDMVCIKRDSFSVNRSFLKGFNKKSKRFGWSWSMGLEWLFNLRNCSDKIVCVFILRCGFKENSYFYFDYLFKMSFIFIHYYYIISFRLDFRCRSCACQCFRSIDVNNCGNNCIEKTIFVLMLIKSWWLMSTKNLAINFMNSIYRFPSAAQHFSTSAR